MNSENLDIRNCDCMEMMREFPDKHFDLAIVDPPYGVGSITYMPCKRESAVGGFIDTYNIVVATLNMNHRSKMLVNIVHSDCSKTTIKNFGDENVAPPPEYFKELFRVSKHQIIWGGNYFLLPPSRCFVAWRKTNVPENFSMAMCEYAWTSFCKPAKYVEANPQGSAKNKRIHPTQKPVDLYLFLLRHFAERGARILDTHMGSGSIAIACHQFGATLTACELDADYYTAALDRIKRETAQENLC